LGDAVPYLELLGQLALRTDDGTVIRDRKPLLVLAALALRATGRMHRNDMARLLWPTQEPANALLSLRQARYQLRSWHADELVRQVDDVLSLDPSLSVDLWAFEQVARDGDASIATDLYSGQLLGEYARSLEGEFASEVDARSASARVLAYQSLERLLAVHQTAGDLDQATRVARSLVALEPLDDGAQSALIETLCDAGDPRAAIAAFEHYRTLLHDEFEDTPSDGLSAVVDQLRASPLKADVGRSLEPTLAQGNTWSPRKNVALVSGAVGAATAALVASIFWPSDDPWPEARRLALPVVVGQPSQGATLTIDEDGIAFEGGAVLPPDWAPLGYEGGYLRTVERDGGMDVVIVRPGEAERLLIGGPDDETSLAASPTGEHVLIDAGRWLNGEYRTALQSVDVQDGSARDLLAFEGNPRLDASWSPEAKTIAVTVALAGDGARSLMLLRPAGEVLATLPDAYQKPGWSPSGERVAVLVDEADETSIVVVDHRGRGEETLARLPATMSTPVWLTEHVLVFVADFGYGGDVWLVDRRGSSPRQVSARHDIGGIVGEGFDRTRLNWLDDVSRDGWNQVIGESEENLNTPDSLRLELPYLPVEGEIVPLGVIAFWPAGRQSSVRPSVLSWGLSGGVEAFPTPGLFRFRGAAGTVTADFFQARDAALEYRTGSTEPATLPVRFEEMWTDSELAPTWVPFGIPGPTVDTSRGRFLNNGDANYWSGAVTAQSFDASDGLTLEVVGGLPTTAGSTRIS
jgi:DNA-binding SARP family transcriptional activator